VTGCCGDDYVAMCLRKTVRQTYQAATGLARLHGDGFLDRHVIVHWSRCHSNPQGPASGFDPTVEKCVGRGIRVEYGSDPRQARRDLLEQLQPFSQQGGVEGAEPRCRRAARGSEQSPARRDRPRIQKRSVLCPSVAAAPLPRVAAARSTSGDNPTSSAHRS
jgi:hypothetical protein